MKKIPGIMATVAGIVILVMNLILKIKLNASVSVIGGGDGPTSIFIAGKIGDTPATFGIILGAVLLVLGIFMLIRKK